MASDLAPTRAPHVHSTAPCHYMSHDHPTPDNGVVSTPAGRGAIRDVVARGWVGGGWALVGARCRANRNVSGTEGRRPGHLLVFGPPGGHGHHSNDPARLDFPQSSGCLSRFLDLGLPGDRRLRRLMASDERNRQVSAKFCNSSLATSRFPLTTCK